MSSGKRYRLLVIPGIAIALLLIGGLMFFKPKPFDTDKAILIELDPGATVRQVMDKNGIIKFINDEDNTKSVKVVFPKSPCKNGHNNDGSQGICVITENARGLFVYTYCKDLKSFANACADGTNSGEIRVREGFGQEKPNPSVDTVYLGLTRGGDINHFVKPGTLVRWAKRDYHNQSRVVRLSVLGLPAEEPCSHAQGSITDTCTIPLRANDYDIGYECRLLACKDPTLHVRRQNPNPPLVPPATQ